jgi:hypothetical protein
MRRATRRFVPAVALALAILTPDGAAAASITYTESGIFSGTYGGFNFTDLPITITGTADTADVLMSAPGIFAVDVTPTATVTDPVFGTFHVIGAVVTVFDIQADMMAGFLTGDGAEIGTIAPEFAGYDLRTSIGLVSGDAFNIVQTFFTDFNPLRLDSASGPTIFTAVGPQAVPEPSSLVLAALSASGLGLAWRRLGRT